MISKKETLLPNNWVKKRLRDVCDINPENLNISEYKKNHIIYIDISSINNETNLIEAKTKISVDEIPSRAKRIVRKNDIIISTVRPYLKAFTKIKDQDEENICSTGFAVLRSKEGLYYDYLYHWIFGDLFMRFMISNMVGSNYPAVNMSDVEVAPIIVPPYQEQIKIADILSNVDNLIQVTQRLINKLQECKNGLMQTLFTQGIGHTDFKDVKFIGTIPSCWKIVKIKEIVYQITDGTHRRPEYLDSGIPFLRVKDIKETFIKWNEVKRISPKKHEELIKRCRPEIGDILLSKNGTVGITRVIDWSQEFSIYVSLCLIKPKHEIIYNKYLAYFIATIGMKQIEYRIKQGTVRNLHLEEIREIMVPVPDLEEQKKIVQYIEDVNHLLIIELKFLEKIRKTKKGLLQSLLSGSKRVFI